MKKRNLAEQLKGFLNTSHKRRRILAGSITGILLTALTRAVEVYTSPSSGSFTNLSNWNFGAGPAPISDSALALNFLGYSASTVNATSDLNLTLNTLNLSSYGSGGATVNALTGGSYAFTGAAQINILGSGGAVSLSSVVLASTATSLTISGAGSGGLSTGNIASNTANAINVNIGTTANNPRSGQVSLGGTFVGGVVLNSGTLFLGGLGDRHNILTINGGALRGNGTIANNITLNNTLVFNSPFSMTLSGTISGTQGVAVRAASGTTFYLSGANTYTGPTTIGATGFAQAGFNDAGRLSILGAQGSILSTSSVSVNDGGTFELNYGSGHTLGNARISATTPITVQSGYVQVIGNGGLIRQSLGTVTASGPTTLLANTSSTTTGTEVTIANLVRTAGGTVTFQGANLGNAAVDVNLAAAQGNFLLTQINGASPTAALVGGSGAAGSAQLKILPWAVGDTTQTANSYALGSGFVTYGPNGVRLLNPTTEYNTTNNFSTAGATDNMRLTSSVTGASVATTINSLYIASNPTFGGAALTITSGALATSPSLSSATIIVNAPLLFGAGGTGEAVISVGSGTSTTTLNQLLLEGPITASSLTKTGLGLLTLFYNGSNNFSGPINLNGGRLAVNNMASINGATALNFNSMFTGTASTIFTDQSTNSETLSIPIHILSGAARFGSNGPLNIASNISGPGALRFDFTPYTITLSGTNSYTGGTFIGGGSSQVFVLIDSDARLGSTADPLRSFVSLEDSGFLRLTGNWTSARAINVSGAGVLDTQGFDATLSGPLTLTDSAALYKVGTGRLVISSANNGDAGGNGPNSVGTIILGNSGLAGGTLALSGAGSLNSLALTFGTNGNVAGNYLFDISAATDGDATDGSSTPWRSLVSLTTATGFTQAHSVQLGNSAGAPVDLRIGSGTFAGTFGGFGKLVKVGDGTLSLTNTSASSFTGGVEIWGGTLLISADSQLGNSGNSITLEGGVLSSNTALSSARNIVLGATPQPILNGSSAQALGNTITGSGALTLSGTISGPGGFNYAGTGGLTLSNPGANTYLGDTQVSGSLGFGAANQLGAASNRVRLNTSGSLILNVFSGTVALGRPLIVTATNGRVQVSGSSATFNLDGPILASNSNGFTKTGPGQLQISGSNPYFFGTLNVGDGTSATGNVLLTGQLKAATVALAANSGATLDMSGLTREIGSLTTASGTTVALGTGGKLLVGAAGPSTSMIWIGNTTGDSTASVTKLGGGLSLLGSGNTFGGGLHLLSSNGATSLGSGVSTTGSLALQSAFTLGAWGLTGASGSSLFLFNNSGNANRLADTQVIYSNGGEIAFTTNTTTASSELAGSLRGAGMTTLTMSTGGTLSFGNATTGLTRIDGGTFLFRAGNANMGSATATTAIANITFGNSASLGLIGGGGGAGSTTISILPYAVGGTTTSSAGISLVTYDANGIRALNVNSEYNVQSDVTTFGTIGATENLRMFDSLIRTTTLSGGTDLTVNSLSIAGTANTTHLVSASNEKLILTSGLLFNAVANVYGIATVAGGTPLGVQTAELQTGAGNTRELNVFTSGDLLLSSKISTTGGLTKSGTANLYLTNPGNSYSGATTINAGELVIDSLAALGNSTSLVIDGGSLRYRGADATLTGFTVKAAGGDAATGAVGGSAGFDILNNITLTLAPGIVSGNGGIYKSGAGVLKLQGTNTQTGATIIATGTLAIDNPAALGTNGRILFGSGSNSSYGQVLRFDAAMTLTQDISNDTSATTVGFGFDTNGNNVTLSGNLSSVGTTGLYKIGAGDLTLTAAETYLGATGVYGGNLILAGASGSILASTGAIGGLNPSHSIVINPGAGLVLDNRVTNNNNRLPDVWDTPLGSGNTTANGDLGLYGGELKIRGNATTATSERVNLVNVHSGTFTFENNGQNVTLNSGRLARIDTGSVGLIRGTNFGALPSATSTNWFVNDLGSGTNGTLLLGGAGGAEGTPFVNILPGFMGDSSATGVGTDFLTYAADTGFRLLTASEYTTTIPVGNTDANRAPNILVSGTSTVNANTQITAVKLTTDGALTGSGAVTLLQGTVLATGTSNIGVAKLQGNAGLNFLTPGAGTTLTVGSVTSGSALSKYGAGTLELANTHQSIGTVSVWQGTLKMVGANASFSAIGSPVVVAAGATLDLGGFDRILSGLGAVSNVANSDGAGAIVQEGTIALGGSRLTLYDNVGSVVLSDSITGTGGLTKALNSAGSTLFIQPLAYTGSTLIYGGSFTLSGRATLASTQIDVRGGSLQFSNGGDSGFAGGFIANRVPLNGTINLAGALTFSPDSAGVANHALGTVNLVGGGNLSLSSSGAPITLTIANLNRAAQRGTINITATNLGQPQAINGNSRLFATQIEGAAPGSALVGAGGAAGSTNMSIIPWASSGGGNFVTYGADGFRPLNTTTEYASNINTAGSTDNVRAAGTLTAPRTVNALLVLSGNLTGAQDLTITSGALAVAAGVNIGVTTNALRSGTNDDRELVINTPFATVLNYNLGTSGGVTKFGTNGLTLNGTNTFTGGLHINEGTVNFSSDSALGASGGAIQFGGSTGTINSTLSYTGTGTLAFNRPIDTESFGVLSGTTGQRWQINQPISGAGGIQYNTTGVVYEVNAVNTYTGATRLVGGTVYINGDSGFGNGGEVIFGNNSGTPAVVLRGDWNTGRLIHFASTSMLNTNGHDASFNGQVVGSASFTKGGLGTLSVTTPISSLSNITVGAGTLRLADRGALSTAFTSVSAGAALLLDDTGVHSADRLPDTINQFMTGAELAIKGSSSVTTEESAAPSFSQASAITLTAGSGQAAILRSTNLTPGGGSLVFRGTNLGVSTPGTANSTSILGTNGSPTMVGGGASGAPSTSIIIGSFGDTSPTGLGSQLVTYDLDKGVRLLNPVTEYTTTLNNGTAVTDNVKVDGGALVLTAPTTANALWMKDGASISGGATLNLTSATVLVTGSGNTITGGLGFAVQTWAFGGPGDLTINGALTGSGGLIKQGAGALTLNLTSSYTGTTYLAGGVVNVGSALAVNGTAIRFQGGELRNTSGAPVSLTGNLTLGGSGIAGGATMKIGGAQDLTFSGTVSLENSTREINVTNTGVTTLSGVIFSSTTLLNYGLLKTGPGRLDLTNANNLYDGETTGNGGELRVMGSISKSSLTTVVSGSLSGTGTVGALKVAAGGTLAPGAGAVGTLNSGNVDFAGGTFALELSGAALADQLNVIGTAGLSADTALTLSFLGGYTPADGDRWTIVQNDGIDAFNAGSYRFTLGGNPLDSGALFTLGGQMYVLDYANGTGNDVVLFAVPEPASTACLLAALPLLGLRRRRK